MHVALLIAIVIWALVILLACRFASDARLVEPVQPTSAPGGISYADLLSLRNTELSTLWTRFNLHLLINSGLLSILLSVGTPRALSSWPVGPYVFGFFLSLLWLLAELAGRLALHTRDAKLREFELRFWPRTTEGTLAFTVFGDIPPSNPLSLTPLRFRWQMGISWLVILAFMLAWSTLIYFSC